MDLEDMPRKQAPVPPPVETRVFRTVDGIERGVRKLERRIADLAALDIAAAYYEKTGADDVVRSDIVETIREVFGPNSPEFREHEHIRIWAGPAYVNMPPSAIVESREKGKTYVTGILQGLIRRLEEKRAELDGEGGSRPAASVLGDLDLHPRIQTVAARLFQDGHHWEAVFNASKALINHVKEKSGRFDLDGAPLVRTVFSRKDPVLAFNELSDQTDLDEQEGIMHLFEGAVLAIRNPGGHSFPAGSPERALEYLELLSLLAYRVDESTLRN
jgi:uncharacterized protein (TIGR02391 family)